MSLDSLLSILYLFLASSFQTEIRHAEVAKSALTQSGSSLSYSCEGHVTQFWPIRLESRISSPLLTEFVQSTQKHISEVNIPNRQENLAKKIT